MAGTQLGLPGIPLGGGIGGAVQSLLGSQAVRSIAEWMMLQQLVQSVLAPLNAEITQTAFGQFPTLVSSPVELAAGVVRGHVSKEHGQAEAKKSGYDKEPFQLLLDNAGQPLALQALLEAWRRGVIPKEGSGAESVSLEQGIRESDLKNKWTPIIEALQWQLATPGVVVEGWLRGQIEEAAARDLLRKNGIDDDTATLTYKSAGRPPSPEQLIELYHRRAIPLAGRGGDTLSVEQGYLETDLKNKWFDKWWSLSEYLPPPRTITALVREGSLTDAEGLDLFQRSGLNPHLAGVYLTAAHHQKTAATRELAKADILAGYAARLFTHDRALALLEAIGWHEVDAKFELALADFRHDHALVQGAVTRLKGFYIARKMTQQQVITALDKLGIELAAQQRLFAVWDVERLNKVERLPAAEWASAAYYGIVTAQEAIDQLVALGYSPYEAWVRVGVRMHGPATDVKPAPGIPAPYTR